MKVAQILSTIPDALPAEYADELAGLQADAPAMGWLFTKRRMASELALTGNRNLVSLNGKLFRQHLLDRCIKRRAER